MKLVYQSNNKTDAAKIVFLLQSKGIPAFIANKSLRRLLPNTNSIGVFIHLNSQQKDAQSLIRDPSYSVESSINIKDFYKQTHSAESRISANNTLLKMLLKTIVILLAIYFSVTILFSH